MDAKNMQNQNLFNMEDDSFDKSEENDDDQDFYNKEFVNQFFTFKTYEEAGKWIV